MICKKYLGLPFVIALFFSCSSILEKKITKGGFLDYERSVVLGYSCESVGKSYLGCEGFSQKFEFLGDNHWLTTIVESPSLTCNYKQKGLNFFCLEKNNALLNFESQNDSVEYVRIFSGTESSYILKSQVEKSDSLFLSFEHINSADELLNEIWVKNIGLIEFTLSSPTLGVKINYELKSIRLL